jgi:hypothetical protein
MGILTADMKRVAAGLRRTAETGGGAAGPGEAGQTLQATALVHEAERVVHNYGGGSGFGVLAFASAEAGALG